MSNNEIDQTKARERLILDLLDATDETAPSASSGNPDSDAVRQEREYREVLGLLAYGAEPAVPSAESKQRILDAIGSSSNVERVRTASRPAATGRGGIGWLLPLAATVALVMIGATGWLVFEVRGQQAQIAELSSRLEAARGTETQLATSEGMLAELRTRLELVTAPGAQFCALRPPEGSEAAQAVGMVVMHPVKDEWFLRVEGLEPCSKGRKYVVWFATEDGTEPGPIFGVKKPGDSIELTVSGRPSKINAIMITLEADPMPAVPSMEPLLFGDERMQVL